MNFQWKNCSIFNNFFTIGWNNMKPTWCTLYSSKAFWLYQECGKRHYDLEDLNMTNKQTTFVINVLSQTEHLVFCEKLELEVNIAHGVGPILLDSYDFFRRAERNSNVHCIKFFVSLRSRLFLEMIRGISTYNWCCVVVLFEENLQSQFCFEFVWRFFG